MINFLCENALGNSPRFSWRIFTEKNLCILGGSTRLCLYLEDEPKQTFFKTWRKERREAMSSSCCYANTVCASRCVFFSPFVPYEGVVSPQRKMKTNIAKLTWVQLFPAVPIPRKKIPQWRKTILVRQTFHAREREMTSLFKNVL